MSFGFSIGDIILCTEIAHRLFTSVTDGRKNAPQDLKELENALFGLYCALGHLQRDHEAILIDTTSEPGNGAVQHLGLMISSCRTTLEQLDNATAKYRDAAHDRLGEPAFAQGEGGLRARLKVQLRRAAWDLRGDSLTKYRQKLQTHADSINLLLTTFIWSSTNRVQENGVLYRQRLDVILQQASQLNSNVSQLLQCLLPHMTIPPTPQHHHHHYDHNDNYTTIGLLGTTKLPIHSPKAAPLAISGDNHGFAPSAQGPPTEIPKSPGTSSLHEVAFMTIPSRPGQPNKVDVAPQPPPAPSVWPKGQFLRLPESIHTINEMRKVVGAKEFEVHRQQLNADSLVPTQLHKRRHLSASKGVDSVQQLGRNVEHIFKTLHVLVASRTTTNHDLQTDVIAWVSRLANVLEQLQASPPVFGKQEQNVIVSELAQQLARLNFLLEESEVRKRGVFYDASRPHIDMVFTKLRSLSTVCAKEIEEFEDEREAWEVSL